MSEVNSLENNVWSCGDIAANASNWSLASDINLLKHLEAFSDRLLDSGRKTDGDLDNLLRRLDETALNLDLARNEFASLSNTQFIESRIYEEDETAVEREPAEQGGDAKPDETTRDELKRAASRGLAVLERCFERVDVPGSDDSDDEAAPSFVLRAKDPYVHRPLPYVIGTQEWYSSANAGVVGSSSESEADDASEKYSDDSESDGEAKKADNRRSITGSEMSEGELSNKLERPVANSTFNDTNKNDDFFESVSQYNSATAQAPISQTSFAEQLAQKLGNVINANEMEANVNTRPIQKQQQDDCARLFSNEPPPIEDEDKNSHGIFSGRNTLFDSLDDDVSFWGEETAPKKTNDPPQNNAQVQNVSDRDANNQKAEQNGNANKKTIRNLFDDSSSSDDELFSTKASCNEPNKAGNVRKGLDDLFEESSPPNSAKPKQPALFSETSQSSDEDEMFPPVHKTDEPTRKKNLSLFDDDSDDLFVTTPKALPPNLFDAKDVFNNNSVEEDAPVKTDGISRRAPNLFSNADSDSDDLFPSDDVPSSKPRIISINNRSRDKDGMEGDRAVAKSLSLFDDDADENRDGLFSSDVVTETVGNESVAQKRGDVQEEKNREGLEGDGGASIERGKNEILQEEEDRVIFPELTEEDVPSRAISTTEDNQIQTNEPANVLLDRNSPADVLFEQPYIFDDIPPTQNIFDDSSPPAEENDFADDLPSKDGPSSPDRDDETASEHRSSIFDDEPPSLLFNQSSGIGRDPASMRLETDVSSFYPYASSSRRLSADTFGVYSEDSLFAARGPAGDEPGPGDAAETPVSSYLEVTPSGKASELYSEASEHPAKPRKSVTFEGDVQVLEEKGDGPRELDDGGSETDGNVFGGRSGSVREGGIEDAEPEVPKEPVAETNEGLLREDVKVEEGTIAKTEEVQKRPEEKASPGKLKHNLNINVQALLPGGGPIRKGLSRPQRPASIADIPNYDGFQPNFVGIPRVNPKLAPGPSSKPKRNVEDAKGENVEVLQSITKTRARIPNRRPSTKRGREAFRKSCIDFTTPTSGDIAEEVPEKQAEGTRDVPSVDNRGSTVNRLETEEPSTTGGTRRSVVRSDNFASPEFNEPGLFDDNDDDLFSEKRLPPKSTILKKNLFDDDDDDELNFFQSIGQSKKTTTSSNVAAVKRLTSSSTVKKLDNVRVTEDDPLSAFGR